MQANLRVFEQASDGEHRTDRNQRVADDLGDVDRDYGKQRRQQADRIAEQAGAPQAQCARALTATRNHEAKGAKQYVQREQGENHQRRARHGTSPLHVIDGHSMRGHPPRQSSGNPWTRGVSPQYASRDAQRKSINMSNPLPPYRRGVPRRVAILAE